MTQGKANIPVLDEKIQAFIKEKLISSIQHIKWLPDHEIDVSEIPDEVMNECYTSLGSTYELAKKCNHLTNTIIAAMSYHALCELQENSGMPAVRTVIKIGKDIEQMMLTPDIFMTENNQLSSKYAKGITEFLDKYRDFITRDEGIQQSLPCRTYSISEEVYEEYITAQGYTLADIQLADGITVSIMTSIGQHLLDKCKQQLIRCGWMGALLQTKVEVVDVSNLENLISGK